MTEDIAYSPGFVAEPDALFARLRAETAWDTRMRARLTASWGVPYDYSQLTYAEAPFPPESHRRAPSSLPPPWFLAL